MLAQQEAQLTQYQQILRWLMRAWTNEKDEGGTADKLVLVFDLVQLENYDLMTLVLLCLVTSF